MAAKVRRFGRCMLPEVAMIVMPEPRILKFQYWWRGKCDPSKGLP